MAAIFGRLVVIRQASSADAARIDIYLAKHAPTTMFLRSNLARYGTDDRTSPHGTAFLLCEAGDSISGLVGITNGGMLMAEVATVPESFWPAVRGALAGRQIIGMTGVPAQVARTLDALGLAAAPMRMCADEPLYELDLAGLSLIEDNMRHANDSDIGLLTEWFSVYVQDTGTAADPVEAAREGARRAGAAVGNRDVCLLLSKTGAPVAMAGINARLPDIVQLGGVYVPPRARNRRLGRRATAGLLTRARAEGVLRAVLFANNAAAARAYEAIGFDRIGQYRVALFATPQCVDAAP